MNSILAVVVVLSVLVMNLPFGYWRSGTRRMSCQWMLAIHIPVAISVILRLTLLGHNWSLLPAFVAAFALGQLGGGQVRKILHKGISRRPVASHTHRVAVQTGTASNLRLR